MCKILTKEKKETFKIQMFELIKPLSLYKTTYVVLQSLQRQLRGAHFFIDYLKLFKLFSVLYFSVTMSQILVPKYEALFVPL